MVVTVGNFPGVKVIVTSETARESPLSASQICLLILCTSMYLSIVNWWDLAAKRKPRVNTGLSNDWLPATSFQFMGLAWTLGLSSLHVFQTGDPELHSIQDCP